MSKKLTPVEKAMRTKIDLDLKCDSKYLSEAFGIPHDIGSAWVGELNKKMREVVESFDGSFADHELVLKVLKAIPGRHPPTGADAGRILMAFKLGKMVSICPSPGA